MLNPFRHRKQKNTQNSKCERPERGKNCKRRVDQITLADVPSGSQVRIVGFCSGLPAERRAHLLAYGMTPGYTAKILQHSPVTVIRIEHIELAMEVGLACEILVESPIEDNVN